MKRDWLNALLNPLFNPPRKHKHVYKEHRQERLHNGSYRTTYKCTKCGKTRSYNASR